jgi:hypothetical protein
MWFSRAGGRPLGCGHLGGLLVVMILALGAAPAAGAGGTSGGAGVPSPVSPKHSSRSHGHSPRPPSNPFTGRGMWIWYVSASNRGNLASIIASARTYGISTLMVKSGDGATAWSQFSPQLVRLLHAAGLKVCAWQYVYGAHPIYEAQVGAAAVAAGADCLLIDAESEYEGRYVQAQEYVKELRQRIGSSFPLALAGFPYVDYHPAFPYSVFLGPGGAQYNVPQMYWVDIGASVDDVYAHTFAFNWLYQRPIQPIGELAGNPAPGQVLRFRQLSRLYGSTGVSWWDWQQTSQRDWRALGQPVGNLPGLATAPTPPLLSLAGQGGIWAGDLVVWAQEHLIVAGQPVQVDGSYGPETQLAVEQFQSAHGLPVTGMIDPPTWQSLLVYKPVSVTWVRQGGKTLATTSRAGLHLSVPWSARLRARRDEIPADLGAGGRAAR